MEVPTLIDIETLAALVGSLPTSDECKADLLKCAEEAYATCYRLDGTLYFPSTSALQIIEVYILAKRRGRFPCASGDPSPPNSTD